MGRALPNNPYGWGCGGSLAVLAVLTLLGSTPFRLGNNQPGLLFLLLGLGFVAGFSVAARIQWRNRDAPAESGAQRVDDDIGQVTAGLPSGNLSQAPSRATRDTLSCAGVYGGAGLGFAAILVLALNGIVGNDAWLVLGAMGGAIIGSFIAALVLRRLERRT